MYVGCIRAESDVQIPSLAKCAWRNLARNEFGRGGVMQTNGANPAEVEGGRPRDYRRDIIVRMRGTFMQILVT